MFHVAMTKKKKKKKKKEKKEEKWLNACCLK